LRRPALARYSHRGERTIHMFRTLVFVCALAVAAGARLAATSFEPVTFDDLVTQSDVIFVGDVVDVHPYILQVRDRTIVKTRVTFRVDDPLYGTTSLVEVFDFLGGETPELGMTVAGMPTFTVGDRRVVFARRDRSINPFVGFTQGLMKVAPDVNGIDRVTTLEGLPVARLSDFRARINGGLIEARKK
jgi:hypothetical protein